MQGKQSGSSGSAPIVSDLQKQYTANAAGVGTQGQSNALGLGQALPGLYNSGAGGVNQAATGLANTANTLQQNMGQGGAQGYGAGMNALQNIASPEYQQAQMNAAMIPAQLQYQQNLSGQNAGFGGAGQIGSARNALANQQLAGLTQLQQQQAAAGVLNNITNQQLQAGQGLIGGGIQGGQLGLQAGQQGINAAGAPLDFAAKYGSINNLLNQYGPNFSGMIGQQGTTEGSQSGIKF